MFDIRLVEARLYFWLSKNLSRSLQKEMGWSLENISLEGREVC